MKSKMYEIKCVECESVWMIKCETLVHSSNEKDLRKMIMNGSFFTRKCSKCGNLINFYYPFLYCDMKHHFLIAMVDEKTKWIDELNSLPQYSEFIKRIVKNEDELIEKINIFEHRLSDVGINKMKIQLSKKYHNVYFDGLENDVLWFRTDQGQIGVEKRFYNPFISDEKRFIIL